MRIAARMRAVSPSATLDIASRAKKMKAEGIDVVSFGAGEPDYDTPDHIKASAIKAITEGFTKYTPSSGMPELREAIAKKFAADNGIDYAASQIVVSCGAKHSLYNIFQVICDDGDEVLIPSPYWLSYPEMVRMAGGVPVYVPTEAVHNFRATEREIAARITPRTRALILNSPSNPTGCVYTRDALAAIAALAVRHGFLVISDEIYEKLVYGAARHISIASLGKEIREATLTVNGVSKSYSMTGWRIGYAAGPAEIMTAIANFQSHATSNAASMSQRAALAALTGDQACVETMRREFEKRRDAMMRLIRAIPKLSCPVPDGAFYAFCDASKLGMDSVTLANRLLDEARVAVVPGAPFGADRSIRISFAIGMPAIEKGLERIKEWIEDHG